MSRLYFNPRPAQDFVSRLPGRAPVAFHHRLPGYEATPLQAMPDLAAELGIGAAFAKIESSRMGLPSFKILGASWAAYRTLVDRLGREVDSWTDVKGLETAFAKLKPCTFVAATEGNHGRAVARVARWFGFPARIYVPEGTSAARTAAIASEGAECVAVPGAYEDAVEAARLAAGPRDLLLSDTSWTGHEQIPARVVEGYATLFFETDDELAAAGEAMVDLVLVQIGVGALAAATVRHYRRPGLRSPPRLVGVEPSGAAPALASVEAGRIVTIPGPHPSIMAGLNCGRVASLAYPVLRDGVDAFAAIDDERCMEAMRILAQAGIVSGESGAAGLAGLLDLLRGPQAERAKAKLGLGPKTRALFIVTEGATDPESWRRIVGTTRARG